MIGVPDDSDSSAIAETVVAMGRKLGLNVVAEGVETSDQCRFLRACGCKLLQGSFVAAVGGQSARIHPGQRACLACAGQDNRAGRFGRGPSD